MSDLKFTFKIDPVAKAKLDAQIQSLIDALKAGNYNATPSELVQGQPLIIEDLDFIFNKPLYTPPACECGAAKVGIKPFKPGHSTWCPQTDSEA